MNSADLFSVVFPVFALAAVGWAFARVRTLNVGALTEVVVYLAGPALVFVSLLEARVAEAEVAQLVGGSIFIVVGVGVIVKTVASLTGVRPGALYLPAMFMNAGNMLLPLTLFAFGDEGLRRGVLIFSTVVMLQSSLGVSIAGGRADVREMFRLPYFYAVIAAVALRWVGTDVPDWGLRPLRLVADTAVPLMLLALGARLADVRVVAWRGPCIAATTRICVGYAVGLLFVTMFGAEGTTRGCILIASAMPAAVVNFVFAEKYGGESSDVAAAVLLSTCFSIVTTPLLLAYGL